MRYICNPLEHIPGLSQSPTHAEIVYRFKLRRGGVEGIKKLHNTALWYYIQ